MPKTTADFFNEIDEQRKKNERMRPGNSIYGDNVMPLLKMYAGLSAFEERRSFREALETMLADQDPKRREFAVTLCLGFFVFRDSI